MIALPAAPCSSAAAATLCARLVSVAVLQSSAELLLRDRVLRDDGMLSWPVLRLGHPRFLRPWCAPVWDAIFGFRGIRLLLLLRLLLAAAVLAGPARAVSAGPLLPCLALLHLLLLFRSPYGDDGSDQMTTIVLCALALGAALPAARPVALGFIAFQACLAYGVAGWAKAGRREWWNGRYAISVSKTQTFGAGSMGAFLDRHRRLAAVLSSGMVLWELSFPLVAVLPLRAVAVLLAIGLCFHLVNAVHMGLNTFVWAFGSTYPALFYLLRLRG